MTDARRLQGFVDALWDEAITPTLVDYIRIPNKSPAFDPEWAEHGHMDRAVVLLEAWALQRLAALPGATLEVARLEGRTPVILIEVPGAIDDTVLLYGHLDKQPEMTGWSDGLGPWTPVIRGERLYGRGGADDRVAVPSSVAFFTEYRRRDMGSTARQPSSSSSIEKPLIDTGSPRWARAACSAFCQDSASTKSDSFSLLPSARATLCAIQLETPT